MIKKIFTEKIYFSFALIVIFHLVGLIGFTNEPLAPLFKKLVPYHLLLMLGILLWNNSVWNKYFIGYSLFLFSCSFIVEMLGTNTGLIFGKYIYGDTLGLKIFNTPLLIGVNWFLLVIGVSALLSYLKIHNIIYNSILGASILTLLDALIEPIAIKFDYWQWSSYNVPTQYYIAWWLLSFVFILIINKLHFNMQNIVAAFLLMTQFLFFILLNLL